MDTLGGLILPVYTAVEPVGAAVNARAFPEAFRPSASIGFFDFGPRIQKRLLREGVSIAEVARRLGRSRQTIYNWLEKGEEVASTRRRPSKLDRFRPYIRSRLERFDLPATVLFRELRKRGYRGGLTILRELVASIKARHVKRPDRACLI